MFKILASILCFIAALMVLISFAGEFSIMVVAVGILAIIASARFWSAANRPRNLPKITAN